MQGMMPLILKGRESSTDKRGKAQMVSVCPIKHHLNDLNVI